MSQINPKKIISEKHLIIFEGCVIQQVGVDLATTEEIIIPHGHFKNVLLNAEVHLPDNIYATFIHRSSFNRRGVIITGSIYDPGYEGVVGCSIYNFSGGELKIGRHERIGQMMFFDASATSKYNGQYQKEHLQ
jgi:deoxycytidine triphosphate deaminase